MDIHAIIQARTSSSRLPGKVLKPILGKPMLMHQYLRIVNCRQVSRVSIATSNHESDTKLYEYFTQSGISVYRGDLDDVLDRFYNAARSEGPAAHIVRLTGDCPLSDPALIDELISFHLKGGFDYSSNCLVPTLPDGLDAEIMTFQTLNKAWLNAKEKFEREHVTPYIYNPENAYSLGILKSKKDYSHMRWTVDEKEDFELVNTIFEELMPTNPNFGFNDILQSKSLSQYKPLQDKRFQRNIALKEQMRINENK